MVNYANIATKIVGDKCLEVPCATCGRPTLILEGFGDRVKCGECSGEPVPPPVDTVTIQAEGRAPLTIPPLYQYDAKKYPPESLPMFREALQWRYGAMGLLLHGTTGKGKTIAAFQVCEREHNKGRNIKAMSAAKFGYEVSRAFGAFEQDSFLKSVIHSDIFFLDDLGNSKMTDRVAEALFYVIEERVSNLRPIISTMNDVGKTLEAKFEGNFGVAIVRRLREFSVRISFNPKSTT